jgi:hypothetical protein
MTAFAAHFTTLMNQAISKSFFPATSGSGMAGIDSSMEPLGPIFLSHPSTLGSGQINLNLMTSRSSLNQLDGHSLDPAPDPGLLVLDGPDGQVAGDLDFHFDVQQWAVGLSATYGVTDHLDLSLVLPLIDSDVTVRAALGHMENQTHQHKFGQGDLSFRVKYGWPKFSGINWASTFVVQYPTGEPNNFHGTGDYWLSSGLIFNRKWKDRADVTVNLVLDFDASNPRMSQGLWGVGGSIAIVPKRLVGVLEFLGRSQFNSVNPDGDTDVFYVRDGRTEKMPLFGLDFPRADYIDVAFGVRILIQGSLTAFVSGRYALNEGGLRDSNIEPNVGLGMTF